ncbi:hypothetical protein X777_02682 [Ooceraea biroi]|uniref:Uncharacterized protein n=1 Tax=Ooceraea biroi TaxID=2015173 RepID=A0A026WME0_OOCBI|nr:hypothetical protein X777_02682 [Ooceraea biroi]
MRLMTTPVVKIKRYWIEKRGRNESKRKIFVLVLEYKSCKYDTLVFQSTQGRKETRLHRARSVSLQTCIPPSLCAPHCRGLPFASFIS